MSLIIWQFSSDQDFNNYMNEPAGKTQPSNLKEFSCDGTDARAVAILHMI